MLYLSEPPLETAPSNPSHVTAGHSNPEPEPQPNPQQTPSSDLLQIARPSPPIPTAPSPVPEPASQTKAPTKGLNSTQSVTVLLIDDQPLIAESLRRLLKQDPGIHLHYCSQPIQAIPLASEISPTVILLDVTMPEVDGLMLLKFLRANPATHQVPIVMLSTHEEAAAKAQAFANGANDYLVKLPDPIELIARLRYHSGAYVNLLERDAAEKTLALYNHELEERVEQRTAELQQTLRNLRKTQGQLIHDEKMTSLGLLLAGIAHEINNPINFIAGNITPLQGYMQDLLGLIELYQDARPQTEPVIQERQEQIDLNFIRQDLPNMLNSLQMGVERISDLVLSLRNFSRHDEADVKTVDIHEGLESTLLILKQKLKDIEIVKDYGPLPHVRCYPSQLNQVFMNILANAADALSQEENRGAIVWMRSESPTIKIHTFVPQPGQVTIQITDNGPGIPPEIKSQMFDPFFTTKPVGQGTGLGLSISHQIIVEQHGGAITCESEWERGTTFNITIPMKVF